MLRSYRPSGRGTTGNCTGSHKSNCAGFGEQGKGYRGHIQSIEKTLLDNLGMDEFTMKLDSFIACWQMMIE